MAVATIVPHAASPLDVASAPTISPVVDDLHALAADEHAMLPHEAIRHALYLQPERAGYAAGWDSWAFLAGSDDAMPF